MKNLNTLSGHALQQNTATSFNNLPDEIKVLIFIYLADESNGIKDLYTATAVCQYWRNIINDEYILNDILRKNRKLHQYHTKHQQLTTSELLVEYAESSSQFKKQTNVLRKFQVADKQLTKWCGNNYNWQTCFCWLLLFGSILCGNIGLITIWLVRSSSPSPLEVVVGMAGFLSCYAISSGLFYHCKKREKHAQAYVQEHEQYFANDVQDIESAMKSESNIHVTYGTM